MFQQGRAEAAVELFVEGRGSVGKIPNELSDICEGCLGIGFWMQLSVRVGPELLPLLFGEDVDGHVGLSLRPLDAVVVDLVAAAAHHGREAEGLAGEGTVRVQPAR